MSTLDDQGETTLLVAVDGAVAGVIGVRDTVRPEAHDVVHELKHLKIGHLAVLTGDREPVARRVAKQVHLKSVLSELLPADKAAWIKEQQEAGRKVAMVGDGINDAPALAQADAGIALGGIGADLAAEAGDLIVLGDPLRNLPALVELSRATVRVIRQNIIVFAFGFNAAGGDPGVAGRPVPGGGGGPPSARLAPRPAQRDAAPGLRRLGRAASIPPAPGRRQVDPSGSTTGWISSPRWRRCVLARKAIAGGALALLGLLYAASGSRQSGRASPAWSCGSAGTGAPLSRGFISGSRPRWSM